MKIKIICGYRKDQEYTIDGSEAHKAYYLFHNPDKRAVFSDGLAIKGDQIQSIVPDYHATMGWNATHVLTSDDMNELRDKGVDTQLRNLMSFAKGVAHIGDKTDLQTSVYQLKDKYPKLLTGTVEYKSGHIRELLPVEN